MPTTEAYLERLFTPQSYEEGIGHYSLCEKCNKRTGHRHVHELTKRAKALTQVVLSQPCGCEC